MKLRGPIFISALAIFVFAAAYWPPYDSGEKEAILMQTILGGLNQLHFQPQDIDNEFSEKAFDLYIDRLDNGRRWLLKSDVEKLKAYKTKIDDEMDAGSYELFNLSTQLVDAGKEKTRAFYKEILAEPFDFERMEDIEMDGDKRMFAETDQELKECWRMLLKYDVMTRLASKIEKQNEDLERIAKGEDKSEAIEEKYEKIDKKDIIKKPKKEEVTLDEDFKEKTVAELEAKCREEVLKRYDDWYDRLDKERRTDRLSSYLNAITNVYDPHTSYYEPKDKENFDINMSGTLEGIGARLQTDGEYTKIISIVAGGPAWKGKELDVDDKIMKVAQGDDEPLDITGWRIDDVVKKIRGKKGTEVKLTVRKVDGSTEVISIIRDVVIMDEGYAKSAILDYDGVADNVGYILLPRFYADFNRSGGRNCFKDMKKEIEKLKAKGVNDIIIDLRNNGGGSLRDVVKMSGLFIEEGPIVQVKARRDAPEVLSDEDPSVQFKGNLIVMVNKFSASASEILAAALQDYGRAVIVGSNSTFGKGTVQRFFDLDRAIRGNSEIKPLGQVKMTIQKFYRVDGGSTQLRGVTPDIILPDNYSYIKTGEQDQEFALPWTEIEPVEYSQNVTSLDYLPQLKKLSAERVSKSDVFQTVEENAKRLKERRDQTIYSLNLEKHQSMEEELDELADKYESIFKEIDGLNVNNLEVDLKEINIDEAKQERNKEWIEGIKEDAYIEECLYILRDMQNMK